MQVETPLWPVAWLQLPIFRTMPAGLSPGEATIVTHPQVPLMLTLLGLTAYAVLFRGDARPPFAPQWQRVAAAILFLMLAAYASSFGKVNHDRHMLLWTLIVLAAIPTRCFGSRRWGDRLQLVEGVWRALFLVMVFYFLSGFWKLVAGGIQWSLDEPNLFRLDAMPRQLAARLWQTRSESAVGDWLIDHPAVATPLLWAAVYLEAGSLVIPFRPALHRIWGVALIGLHIGIGLAMTIWFHSNFIVVGLLLICSPWDRGPISRRWWRQLPGLAWLLDRPPRTSIG